MLMLAAVHQVRWLTDTPDEIIRIDPVRMAHGVLTGIGFLCGGVIFREGFTVRGLTTAASLWSTATLGVLFGVGFYGLAVLGGLTTLLVLAAVSLTEAILPQRRYADLTVRYRHDTEVSLVVVRRLLVDHALRPQAISQTLDQEGWVFSTTIGGYSEDRAEALATTFRQSQDIVGFSCLARNL
ncbi:MAG: magnesium transporter [Brevundimonas sp.]|nr:magnesium transporter [Brevundimonas sp.]